MHNVTIFFGAPGCGKTRTLIDVLLKELKEVSPEQIAYVSFTRKGAYEGRDRALDILGYDEDDFPFFRTIHSLAFRDGGYKKTDMMQRKQYKEFSDSMGMRFLGYYTEDLISSDDRYIFLHLMRTSNIKNYNSIHQNSSDLNYRKFTHVASNYELFKSYKQRLDYNDLLLRFIEKDTPLPVRVAFIDEVQDLTRLQWDFCQVAFRDCERIYIGGDDDQAIYEWLGADLDKFLSLKGERVILNQSYRMRSNILTFSNKIVSMITDRVAKQFAPIEEGGNILRYNKLEELEINPDESYYFLSRNNCFLIRCRAELERRRLVYWNKDELSVDKKIVEAIHIYEKRRKIGRFEHKKDELTLKKYLIHRSRMDLPWYANFNLNPEEVGYYRDLIKEKRNLSGSNIKVNTIHGVKGGEADNVVLLLDFTRGIRNAIEYTPNSEFRCLYVACTRAKKTLHLVHSITGNGYDHVPELNKILQTIRS